MNTPVKISLVMGLLLPLSPVTWADLLENDSLKIINKNFYMYRDFRDGASNPSGANSSLPVAEREGYRSEWAHGIIANYSSGYTNTPIQIGFDAYGLLGIKLYSDRYKTGTNLLEFDPITGETKDAYGELGGSIRAKYNDTVLTFGNQFPNLPIIATSTVRLLPTVSTGWTVQDKSFDNLTINAGHFYQMNPFDSTENLNHFTTDYSVGIKADSLSYLGGTYQMGKGSVTAYVSELEDVWNQYYLGANYQHKLNDEKEYLRLNVSSYANKDTGDQNGGEIESYIGSAILSYQNGAHTLTVGYQQVMGPEPFDWVGFGSMGSNKSIVNAVNFSTFSEAKEKSVQLKYEVDLNPYGMPGLSVMGRYMYGWDMDNTHSSNSLYNKRHVYDQNIDNKHWERNFLINYKVSSGFAKGTDIKLMQSTHRATAGYRYNNIDEFRIILEHPLNF